MDTLFKKPTYYYEQGEYTIEVVYTKDKTINRIITEFWIQKENYGTKLFMLGELGAIQNNKKEQIIKESLKDWIEDYEFQIKIAEEALTRFFERRDRDCSR